MTAVDQDPGECGTFIVISSMTADYTTITHQDGMIIGGAEEGTSTTIESSGGPFVEGGARSNDVHRAWKAHGCGPGPRVGLHVDDARRGRGALHFEEKRGRRRRRRRRRGRALARGRDRQECRRHRVVHLRGRLSGEQPIRLARGVRLATEAWCSAAMQKRLRWRGLFGGVKPE